MLFLNKFIRFAVSFSLAFSPIAYADSYTDQEMKEAFRGYDSGDYVYDESNYNGNTVYTHSIERCRKQGRQNYCETEQIRCGDHLDMYEVVVNRTTTEWIHVHIFIVSDSQDYYLRPKVKINMGVNVEINSPETNQSYNLRVDPSISFNDISPHLPALKSQIDKNNNFQKDLEETNR